MANVFGQLAQIFIRFPAGEGFVVNRSDEGAVTGVLLAGQWLIGSLPVGERGEAAHDGH